MSRISGVKRNADASPPRPSRKKNGKGQKRAPTEENVRWNCPICLEELFSPGVVPCCLTSCGGENGRHVVCAACLLKLNDRHCPICTKKFDLNADVEPLIGLSDASNPETKKVEQKMQRIKRPCVASNPNKIEASILRRREVLASQIIEVVTKTVEKAGWENLPKLQDANIFRTVPIPPFEKGRFKFLRECGSTRGVQKARKLNLMYEELQPRITAHFRSTNFRVEILRIPIVDGMFFSDWVDLLAFPSFKCGDFYMKLKMTLESTSRNKSCPRSPGRECSAEGCWRRM
jgi:hypothetical protein